MAKRTGLKRQAKSLGLTEKGVRNTQDFVNVMGAMMADVAAGRLTPHQSNAMANAGGKMLRAVELQLKYGTTLNQNGDRVLKLADGFGGG